MTGATAQSAVGFWAGYWRTLKPLSVEEPIDVWVHRPLAYVLAKACYPTPVSPNTITFCSILLGLASGASFFVGRLGWAGFFLFSSAVFDCADGQLARMRGTSSRFGRMLDGVADLVVSVAAVCGAMWVLLQRHHEPLWLGVATLAVAVTTVVTGSFHTTMYDHYKNVFLRLTTPNFREGEDYATALARYREHPAAEFGPLARLAWPVYLFYVKSQESFLHGFDPYTAPSLSALPEYSEARAHVYRMHAEPLMKVWRGWFGFGSLVFGISMAAVFDVVEWYMLARLSLQNAVFYGFLRPRQRRASREAFAALGLSVTPGPSRAS